MKKQLKNFILAGIVNTLFYYMVYSFCIFFGIDYKLSVLFATIIGIFFSFKTFSKYVFDNDDNSLIFRFILVYIILYVANIVLIRIFQVFIMNYYISGFFATVCCAVLSFILNKWYVFKKMGELDND